MCLAEGPTAIVLHELHSPIRWQLSGTGLVPRARSPSNWRNHVKPPIANVSIRSLIIRGTTHRVLLALLTPPSHKVKRESW
jgi:hypothetical protein